MPYSDNSLDDVCRQLLGRISLRSCLDVGAGAGKYGNLIRQFHSGAYIEAVEIESDYVSEYSLSDVYDTVHCMPAHELIDKALDNSYDLVTIGDCLEHMKKSQGLDLLHFLIYRTRYLYVTFPMKYIQGTWNGHKAEAHISVWNEADFAWLDHISIRHGSFVAVAANGYLMNPEEDIRVQVALSNSKQ